MKQLLLVVAEGHFLIFDDVRGVVRHLYSLELPRKWSWTQLSVRCGFGGFVSPDAGFAGPWPVRAALVRRIAVLLTISELWCDDMLTSSISSSD